MQARESDEAREGIAALTKNVSRTGRDSSRTARGAEGGTDCPQSVSIGAPVNVLGTTRSTRFSGTADAAPRLGEISYAACGAGVKPPAAGP